MRCATILALMLFVVAAKVPPASALLFLTPLAEMDHQQPLHRAIAMASSVPTTRQAPRDRIQMPQANITWGMAFRRQGSFLPRTPSSQIKHVTKSFLGERW